MAGKSISRFSTAAAAAEELITPPVEISYTKNLINGHFVDAASGYSFSFKKYFFKKSSIKVLSFSLSYMDSIFFKTLLNYEMKLILMNWS